MNKSGKKILLVIGWAAIIYSFIISSIFTGLVGAGIGVVIRKDYQDKKTGLLLIIFGILGALSGPILGSLFIWTIRGDI
ncbi:MAG: hypothetical protein ACQEUT_11740 [Bacillota bacterium]